MRYGIAHSKQYKPSVISAFLADRDDKGNLLKLRSDVHLLIHQKTLQRDVGTDVVRDYFDSIARHSDPSFDTSKLTNDQLFALIPPKAVNNLTTRWEYSRYLEEHDKELKQRFKDYKEAYEKQSDLDRWLKKNFKLDKDDKDE